LGGDVITGKIRKLAKFRLFRMEKVEKTEMVEGEKKVTTADEKKLIGEAKIASVQLGQKETNEINEGTECGMKVDHNNLEFLEGDILELFVVKK